MTDLAPILQGFFTDRLARQKKASPNTGRGHPRHVQAPARLRAGQDRQGAQQAQPRRPRHHADRRVPAAPGRQTGERQRHPERPAGRDPLAVPLRGPAGAQHPAVISQVLAIPPRRHERAIVSYLTPRDRRPARRPRPGNLARPPRPRPAPARRPDRAAGIGAQRPRPPGHAPERRPVRPCHGKGRKDRATPLTSQTVKTLRTWLAECSPTPDGPLFPTRAEAGSPATPSSGSSPSTQPRQKPPARRSRRRSSLPTRSGTPLPCHCCEAGWTPP